MAPFWNSLHSVLAKEKPSQWTGYRCEVAVELEQVSGRFLVSIQYHDGVSNRAKDLRTNHVLDLVASLHESYRKFDGLLEWRKVCLFESWDEKEQQWCRRTNWEYGRSVFEAGPDDVSWT